MPDSPAPFDTGKQPHRRFNPLLREWILVSPHRTQRPWQGQMETKAAATQVAYDPECFMCPGNKRSTGAINPDYKSIFLFDNDFPALLPNGQHGSINEGNLLIAETETGICRVLCFSPKHHLTLSIMEFGDIRAVVDCWAQQFQELGANPEINYVQIFENRGAMMGASNPHPHCQIWSTATIPNIPAAEQESQIAYRKERGTCLLCEYYSREKSSGIRTVVENDHFLAVVPFWAIWPFETMILSCRHVGSMDELSGEERNALSDILKRLTTRYDNLFQTSFPYSMGFHQRPTDGKPHPEWHFHAHFFPPLLRSATVRKFMVGFELLAMPQRDITAETSAERLRAVPDSHHVL
ncbi:MAG: UDP-glucose--hexose-1-phosphate uridylyltransferase [Acidobacteria bacterium]|nr:UDP-glucose--hexose-1-phosphate uridylyltransferase [Acidobacteriota bacterium]MBS1864926.1 UDP-glucose--hexose-1-phosphate uridylyltransferase [Acidobacteriota bacterium]